MLSRPCRKRRPSAREDGGVSGVSSSCGACGGFLTRHDEDLREPLVPRQGTHVSITVQLSHPYMITGKTIASTRRTFVGKVMCLLCNMLSKLVIAFLPRSKHLLISWLQSPSAVILEPRKIKSVHVGATPRQKAFNVYRSQSSKYPWALSHVQ